MAKTRGASGRCRVERGLQWGRGGHTGNVGNGMNGIGEAPHSPVTKLLIMDHLCPAQWPDLTARDRVCGVRVRVLLDKGFAVIGW